MIISNATAIITTTCHYDEYQYYISSSRVIHLREKYLNCPPSL